MPSNVSFMVDLDDLLNLANYYYALGHNDVVVAMQQQQQSNVKKTVKVRK